VNFLPFLILRKFRNLRFRKFDSPITYHPITHDPTDRCSPLTRILPLFPLPPEP
jgi:hypothetical protein